MCSQMIAVLVLLSGSPAVVEPDAFSGDWEVTRIIEAKKDGHEWSVEIKYPRRMTPKGKLHAVVTSHEKLFEWIAERR